MIIVCLTQLMYDETHRSNFSLWSDISAPLPLYPILSLYHIQGCIVSTLYTHTHNISVMHNVSGTFRPKCQLLLFCRGKWASRPPAKKN